jgi:hypothetical protein
MVPSAYISAMASRTTAQVRASFGGNPTEYRWSVS